MDSLLDHAFSTLEAGGILDDALIFILADHGEEFFEHGGFSHGHDVHQEQVHVPLVVLWPEWLGQEAPLQVNDPVSLLDLLPTLSELLDLPTPDAGVSGISLLPLLRGEISHNRPVAEAVYRGSYRAAYREGSYKVRFVLDAATSPRDTGEIEVFDLRSDPAELHPLLLEGEVAAIAGRAREALHARRQSWPDPVKRKEPTGMDDDTIEQLRVLGYVD